MGVRAWNTGQTCPGVKSRAQAGLLRCHFQCMPHKAPLGTAQRARVRNLQQVWERPGWSADILNPRMFYQAQSCLKRNTGQGLRSRPDLLL